jgi:hypothetical protein
VSLSTRPMAWRRATTRRSGRRRSPPLQHDARRPPAASGQAGGACARRRSLTARSSSSDRVDCRLGGGTGGVVGLACPAAHRRRILGVEVTSNAAWPRPRMEARAPPPMPVGSPGGARLPTVQGGVSPRRVWWQRDRTGGHWLGRNEGRWEPRRTWRLIEELQRALRDLDLERYRQLLADDATLRTAGVPTGSGGVLTGRQAIVDTFRLAAGAGSVEIKQIFGDDKQVCVMGKGDGRALCRQRGRLRRSPAATSHVLMSQRRWCATPICAPGPTTDVPDPCNVGRERGRVARLRSVRCDSALIDALPNREPDRFLGPNSVSPRCTNWVGP